MTDISREAREAEMIARCLRAIIPFSKSIQKSNDAIDKAVAEYKKAHPEYKVDNKITLTQWLNATDGVGAMLKRNFLASQDK